MKSRLLIILLLCMATIAGAQPSTRARSFIVTDLVPKITANALKNGLYLMLDATDSLSKRIDSIVTAGVGGGGSDGNNYPTSLSFGTGTSNLTMGRNGLSSLTASIPALFSANNLSDLSSASTARTNLGLGNVTNTSDASKPVSTAQAAAIAAKNIVTVAVTGTTTKTLTLTKGDASTVSTTFTDQSGGSIDFNGNFTNYDSIDHSNPGAVIVQSYLKRYVDSMIATIPSGGGTLDPPVLSSLVPNGSGTATATWTAVAGATSYDIDFSTSNSFTSPITVTGVTSPYSKTGLTNSTLYYCRVRGVKVGWTSTNSNTLSATPVADIPLSFIDRATTNPVGSTGNTMTCAGDSAYATSGGGTFALSLKSIDTTGVTDDTVGSFTVTVTAAAGMIFQTATVRPTDSVIVPNWGIYAAIPDYYHVDGSAAGSVHTVYAQGDVMRFVFTKTNVYTYVNGALIPGLGTRAPTFPASLYLKFSSAGQKLAHCKITGSNIINTKLKQ